MAYMYLNTRNILPLNCGVCSLIGFAIYFSCQRTFKIISDFVVTGEGKPIRRGKQSDKIGAWLEYSTRKSFRLPAQETGDSGFKFISILEK
jgi:hypothetical protein